MRFEVHYPAGSAHEVELQGSVATLGRDPSCDLVLNDVKCSRRHAVLEAGPQGIAVRDTGSANGVFVNGKKVERANLRVGDEIRLGEVSLRVLPEEVVGTLVMGPEDVEGLGHLHKGAGAKAASEAPPVPDQATMETPAILEAVPRSRPAPAPVVSAPSAAAARPARPIRPSSPAPAGLPPAGPTEPSAGRPRPRPSGPARVEPRPGPVPAEPPRTLTVTVLAVLWLLSVVVYGGGAIGVLVGGRSMQLPPWVPLVTALGLGFSALLSVAMAWGLLVRAGWARIAQIGIAGLGVLTCVASLPSLAVLIYMFRPEARQQFSRTPEGGRPASASGGAETGFALAILGTLGLSVLGLGGAALGVVIPQLQQTRGRAQESAVVARLRTVAAQQEAFRAGTCDGYTTLDGLANPAKVIPNYPASGPAFVPAEFTNPEALGYRFDLQVEEPLPPAVACPSESYRRYRYSANPIGGKGRHFVIGPDGAVHAANDHPATLDDPPAE